MEGKDLRNARKTLEMTQSELAEVLGVKPITISFYETYRRKIPMPVEKLVKILLTQKG